MMATEDPTVEVFCRLCLKTSTDYLSLFENGDRNQIAKMLESLTSIKISYDDPAPNLTCLNCFREMASAYKTQQRLIKVEKFLQKQALSEVVVKVEKEECVDEVKTENAIDCENSETIETLQGEQCLEETNDADDKNQTVFKCWKCCKEFNTIIGHKRHIQIHEIIKCPVCPKLMEKRELEAHFQGHESGFCDYCGIQCKNLRAHLKRHCEAHQTNVCEQCGDTFVGKRSFDYHIKNMHKKDPAFVCDHCGLKFFRKESFHKHIKQKHSDEKPFSCGVCSKTFAFKDRLRVHQITHSDKMLFICEFCGKGYKFKQAMNSHKKNVHGWQIEEKFRCTLCSKGFPTRFALVIHGTRKHK